MLCVFFIIITLILHGSLEILVFKSLETYYKKEVKHLIKKGIPHENLILLKFHETVTEKEPVNFIWTKKNEFRFRSEMYDIIKRELKNDTIYFYCYHDLKESGLFANLDKQVSDYLAGNPDKSDNIKSTFNLLNKFFDSEFQDAEIKKLPGKAIYPAGRNESVLNGYISINLPPPRNPNAA